VVPKMTGLKSQSEDLIVGDDVGGGWMTVGDLRTLAISPLDRSFAAQQD